MLAWCRRRSLPEVRWRDVSLRPRVSSADGRWRVVMHAWSLELHEARWLTRGNVEAAAALAATMIFMD